MDTQKLLSLESIRGLAAFVVVLWHFTSVFFPAMISGPTLNRHGLFEQTIFQSPISILFAGNFAVVLFFVLSGFVLTYKFFAGKQQSLFPAAVKRYFRLMPIAALSVIFSYILISLGFMFAGRIANITGSPWASQYFQFSPDLLSAIFQAFIGIFQTRADAASTYNPVLWTIYFELLGSMLVFGIATLARDNSKRWMLYVIAILAFSGTYFCGFIVGLVIADLYVGRKDLFFRIGMLGRFYKIVLVCLCLAIGGYPALGSFGDYGAYYKAVTLFTNDVALSRTILQITASTIIIVLALSWVRVARLLEFRMFVWLGKVSYSLYASHFILLYSLTSVLFITFNGLWGYRLSALIAFAVSLPLLFIVAALLHKFIEEPSIKFAQRVGHWSKS